jgi:hypothetical protein
LDKRRIKMPLNLASPGIVVREVDLTLGRVDPTTDKTGALVAPFAKGPVNVPVVITGEQDLLDTFGKPHNTDKHYEHWMVASSFLAYGGNLNVVRSDDTDLANAFAGTAASVKINSTEDYVNKQYDENVITNVTVAARNPGSWGNDLKVAIIDGKVDQVISGINTGMPGDGTADVQVGSGVTQSVAGRVLAGAGSTSELDGYLKGIVTEVGMGTTDSIGVKVISHVSHAGVETPVDYTPGGVYEFSNTGSLGVHTAGQDSAYSDRSYTGSTDWFDSQTIALSEGTLSWSGLAERPGTSEFAAARGSRFDEVHVVVIDDKGTVSGNAGTILEKHLALSKGTDAEYSAGSPSYWRKYLYNNSSNIFGGSAPAGLVSSAFSSGFTNDSDTAWDQKTDGVNFGVTGNQVLMLAGGENYDGTTDINAAGALTATIGSLSSGYDLFSNPDNYAADFVLMGSANYEKENAQALANKCIAVAEARQDSVAFVSPQRNAFLVDTSTGSVTVNNDETITTNVLGYASAVTSSTYGVIDSGYKYMFDRFADTFRYVPLNGDIAGLCARNDINNFPWFSPAGTARGAILNAVKLAYNPSKMQRDKLYSARVNPVIFSPGAGIVLFGDKTAFGKSSAFDRINVRRLFIYLENAISAAAKDQLFEFNDEITRTNFVNIVEPFLRDVQAKRGISDYVVICDETNNTAAIIDNNEFVADIFIKPARSINFIGLTFVATRTGVSFEEVIGNV